MMKDFQKKSQSISYARRRAVGQSEPVMLYGLHTVAAALMNECRNKHRLLVTRNALRRLHDYGCPLNLPIEEVQPRDIHRLLGQDAVHQGVVLEADPLSRLELTTLPLLGSIVLLDQITDPHNIGAILRSAAAFSIEAVVMTARYAPAETGVMAKAASGALEAVPLVEVQNLSVAIKELKKMGVPCIGLDSAVDKKLDDVLPRQPPVALILGAEGKGLRSKTRMTCTELARLDLPGSLQSLNVSNAAALTFHIVYQAWKA